MIIPIAFDKDSNTINIKNFDKRENHIILVAFDKDSNAIHIKNFDKRENLQYSTLSTKTVTK